MKLSVDDGSNDRTGVILDRYADERIRVVHQENKGAAIAVNTGFDLCRGDWIAELDNDDYLEPTFYETLFKHSDGVDMVKGGFNLVNKEGAVLGQMKLPNVEVDMTVHDANALFTMGICPSIWSAIYRRELLDGVRFGNSPKIQCGDTSFSFLVKSKAKKIRLVKDCLHNYWFDRPGSLSKNYDDTGVILEYRRCEGCDEWFRNVLSERRYSLFEWHI